MQIMIGDYIVVSRQMLYLPEFPAGRMLHSF